MQKKTSTALRAPNRYHQKEVLVGDHKTILYSIDGSHWSSDQTSLIGESDKRASLLAETGRKLSVLAGLKSE